MSGYKNMDGETFLDFVLDEGGMVEFVEQQSAGLAKEDWPWDDIATRIHGLSGKSWRPNADQVQALYWSQKERVA